MQITCLLSFVPSGSLAEGSLCLIPTSPSPSCQYTGRGRYSLGSLAGAGSWKLARGFCHRDKSLPKWRLYDLGESWQRSSSCCRTSSGPELGIKAASGPGGTLGGRHIIIQYGGGCGESGIVLSRVRLFATPWTLAYQVPLSMGFSRQQYWSGLPFPSPGDLPDPGIEPRSPAL